MRIHTATPGDEGFVGDLAGEVFAAFGDYKPLLPKWFRLPGVLTFVAEEGGQTAGYVMLAFFADRAEEGAGVLVGDVLAIAVCPAHQGQSIGRALLEHAIAVCEQAAEHTAIRAVRLSVAETNTRARRLFESCGFSEVPGDFGTYEGGQKALHLERPMPQQPAV